MSIRRRRANYFLPSECHEILRDMIGKEVTGFNLGSRHSSEDEFFSADLVNGPSDLIYRAIGGPFILSLSSGRTIVLYNDDFLGSIVLRDVGSDVDDPSFFDTLESQDKLGERVKIRCSIDLSPWFDIVGRVISAVSVHKLPDNYYYKPIGYDLVCECLIKFEITSFGELLFAGEIRGGNAPADIRIAKQEELDENSLKDLKCIWDSNV